MAVTTNKAVLFLLGGVAAASVVAYSAGMFGPPKPETIAALPGAGEADSKDARLPAAEEPKPSAPEATAPAGEQPTVPQPETPAPEAAPAAPAVVPPSFDVVRVEGDGSIVIAGKAAANAKVDLLVGSNVIGSAAADAGGDFAVVLDDPLKPGDYQIVLRATAPDNVVAMSVETAVVSVPETPEGQVLALVEEPGKPSQMITLPEPQAPASEAKPPQAAAPAEPAPETPAAEAPAAAPPAPGAEQQAALPETAEPAPAEVTPATAGPAVRVEAVEIDGRKIFVAGAADPGRTVRGYANEILLGDAKASPDGRYLIEADRDLAVGDYIIRVDALEADGVKVAARAAVPFEREPGETISAVAPPAQETVTPPAAEAPAAEAPAASATEGTETGGAPATSAGTDTGGGAPAAADTPATALATPGTDTGGGAPAAAASEQPAKDPAAVAEAPATGGQAAQSQDTQSAEASGQQPTQPAGEQPAASPETPAAVAEAPATQAPAGGAPAQASTEQPATSAPSGDTPATPPALAETPAAQTPAEGTSPVAEPPSADEPPAPQSGTDFASAPAEQGELPAPPSADGVTEVLAPKLQSAGGAVIIRRGDSLWRISRRVYGRGVRYSTIYLANQNQIEDPDRIWPGQVFKVPEKSDNGEDADYSTLGDSLTTMPKEGEQAPADAQQ